MFDQESEHNGNHDDDDITAPNMAGTFTFFSKSVDNGPTTDAPIVETQKADNNNVEDDDPGPLQKFAARFFSRTRSKSQEEDEPAPPAKEVSDDDDSLTYDASSPEPPVFDSDQTIGVGKPGILLNSEAIANKSRKSAGITWKNPDGTDDLLYTTNDYGLDLHERVVELEKKVKEQGDELMCMRTAMADVVRRLGDVESKKDSRKSTPRGGSAPMRAVKDSSGMVNQTLPSRPSVPNGTSRAGHRRPPTPDSKRRSFGGGSSSGSDKLKRWSSADSGSFPAGSSTEMNVASDNRKRKCEKHSIDTNLTKAKSMDAGLFPSVPQIRDTNSKLGGISYPVKQSKQWKSEARVDRKPQHRTGGNKPSTDMQRSKSENQVCERKPSTMRPSFSEELPGLPGNNIKKWTSQLRVYTPKDATPREGKGRRESLSETQPANKIRKCKSEMQVGKTQRDVTPVSKSNATAPTDVKKIVQHWNSEITLNQEKSRSDIVQRYLDCLPINNTKPPKTDFFIPHEKKLNRMWSTETYTKQSPPLRSSRAGNMKKARSSIDLTSVSKEKKVQLILPTEENLSKSRRVRSETVTLKSNNKWRTGGTFNTHRKWMPRTAASPRPNSARPSSATKSRAAKSRFPKSSAKKSASLTNLSGRRSSASGPNKDAEYNADEGLVRIYMRGRPVTVYVPSDVENFDISSKISAPAEKLKMEWMYGYRGRDCRNNLHLLPTGEIVYFMAATVVLFNVEEGLQRHYMGHNDDVRCIAVHPDKVTIATGQVAGHDKAEGKPHVRVWDSVTLNTLHVIGLGTFDRAVCCVGFSKFDGGNTLVAVDEANDHCMSIWDWSREKKLSESKDEGVFLLALDESNDHVMSVWDWQKQKKICSTKTIQEPVLAAEFHPLSSNQVITCGKSHIYFWTLEDGKLTKKSGIFEKHDKPKYVLCIAFADNGDVISGDSNGNIYIWGKGNSRIQYAVTGGHEGPIFSLCTLKDGSVLSGGGKDRKIKQWDRNYSSTSETTIPEATGPVRVLCQGKGDDIYVGTTRNSILHGDIGGDFVSIVQAHTDELWGMAVHPTQALFLTCGHDKTIIMWDSETHRPLWTKTVEDSCQSAHFHPSGDVFAIGTTSGRWIAFDTQSRDLVTVHTDGNEQHDIVRYSPDGNYIAIGSHDNYIYVYAVTENGRKYSKVGKCSGHSSYVTHLDWSADSASLQSNSGDYEILFWTASTCKQITSSSSMKDTEWATFTCTLGYPVTGIWPDGSDGTDINSVARSNNSNILATGDDFGKIKLFKYPSNRPKSASNSFSGHSSHVTSVEFFKDDSKMISTGGKDMSCIQWKVEPF